MLRGLARGKEIVGVFSILLLVVGCGSVTAAGSASGADAASGVDGGAGSSGAAGTVGAAGSSGAAGTTGAAGTGARDAGIDVAHDAPRELGSDTYGTVLPQCPAFSVAQTCVGGGTAGGQSFAYCYRCTDQNTGAAVADCVNGSPGPTGAVCVRSCDACKAM